MTNTATVETLTPKEITEEARRRVAATVEEVTTGLGETATVDPPTGLALMKAEEALLWMTRAGQDYDELEIAVLEQLAHRLWVVADDIRIAVEDLPIYIDDEEEAA